jgi:hypothetical protein
MNQFVSKVYEVFGLEDSDAAKHINDKMGVGQFI